MRDDKLIEAMARAIAGAPYSLDDQEWHQVQANESEYLLRMAEARAALAALQREQWVPVSERLPEKEQYPVLVAHQSGAVRMVFGIEPFIDGDWMGYYEPALQGRFLRGITHWMPLPPAPQPEEAL